ncbi:MAG: phospholipid carrier-dependent glycosyltransferase [Candidatus Sulfotelmatobacter sp.]|jgi:dolichyl-phosphate-mannose-protein mannosyltransferase
MENRIASTGLVIGVLSLSFFLLGIGRQSYPVFDEYAYVSGARSLLSGTHDLNPEHPPLAKFLIAGGMKVAGDNPTGWRLAGAICGSLTLVAVFLWTYLLLQNYTLALTAAGLTLFNNFLFVMSRVAMLDVFYFAFVMWGIVAFTAALLETSVAKRRVLIVAAGATFGLGCACKWNAVVSLAAVALVAAVLYLRNSHDLRKVGAPSLIFGLVFIPIATYALAFWPLCHRFQMPFTAGELISLNAFIWHYHVTCPGNPALDSRWYSWLFRSTPEPGLSYLMGNFVVVWGGFFALLICIWRFCKSPALAEGLVILFYASNLLQWVAIPQQRTVYYYYYAPAMFLGVAIAIALNRAQAQHILGVRLNLLILLAAIVFFLYCYPRMAALEAPYDCMFGCWG